MITIQVLNKILQTGDPTLIINNNLDETYFLFYEKQFNFINNHLKKYGNVPDTQTFLSEFPDFQLFDVTESNQYLQEKLFEEHLYNVAGPIATDFAKKLKKDSNEAKDFLLEQLPKLTLSKGNNGIDIIKNAKLRYQEYVDKTQNREKYFMTTGFKEIDEHTKGWLCGEELILFFARTEQGKSWILIKCLNAAWKEKKRVGLISPEMSANKVGFRFDTENANFSNTCLMYGYEAKNYNKYIDELSKNDTPFVVSTPKDFRNRITVSKVRNFCQVNNLQILGIDGVGYLEDERPTRGQQRTDALKHISEDLMLLSEELGIPIIIVTQSNREGDKEGGPEIINIKDSDAIAHNASKIFIVRNDNGVLIIGLKKSRYGGGHKDFKYNWNIDKGEFIYLEDKKVEVRAQKKVDAEEDATSVF